MTIEKLRYLLAIRNWYRKNKNFNESDKIKQKILESFPGLIIEDSIMEVTRVYQSSPKRFFIYSDEKRQIYSEDDYTTTVNSTIMQMMVSYLNYIAYKFQLTSYVYIHNKGTFIECLNRFIYYLITEPIYCKIIYPIKHNIQNIYLTLKWQLGKKN